MAILYQHLSDIYSIKLILFSLFKAIILLILLLRFNENLRKRFFASYYSFNFKFHMEFDKFKETIMDNYNFTSKNNVVVNSN